jgi:hypothetical protein
LVEDVFHLGGNVLQGRRKLSDLERKLSHGENLSLENESIAGCSTDICQVGSTFFRSKPQKSKSCAKQERWREIFAKPQARKDPIGVGGLGIPD